ncbi:MAG: methylmalonyl-CoA epimerase, partial [Dialister sp.]|nr:methylmalonyl-CoA epimerase [Dialister sp.]
AKNGGKNGFQHVALRVDNIVEALAALPDEAKLDKKFRIGAGGCHIAFMHPKATGLLLELTERPGGPSF